MDLRRLASWLALAFVGALAIAALVAALRPDEKSEPTAAAAADKPPVEIGETQPRVPFFLDLGTGERTPLAEGPTVDAPVPSPDGTTLAYSPCGSSRCAIADSVTVANVDGSGAHAIEDPKGKSILAARWSPDGTKLVYQEGITDLYTSGLPVVGNLVVEDLASGRRTQVTDLELTRANWFFLSPRFSDDGERVIFHLPRHEDSASKFDVWSVPVNWGKPKLMLRDASFPVPFPDGKTIAFVPGTGTRGFYGHSIAVADIDGSRRGTLVEATYAIWWPVISPDGTKIAYVDGVRAWAAGGSVYVVEVSTGVSTKVAEGRTVEWLDDDTLIVNP